MNTVEYIACIALAVLHLIVIGIIIRMRRRSESKWKYLMSTMEWYDIGVDKTGREIRND